MAISAASALLRETTLPPSGRFEVAFALQHRSGAPATEVTEAGAAAKVDIDHPAAALRQELRQSVISKFALAEKLKKN